MHAPQSRESTTIVRALGGIALAAVLFTDITESACAQQPTRPAPLFGWRDAVVAVGFGVATLGLFELDKHVAKRAQDKVTQANVLFKDVSTPAELLAWPGGFVLEGGMYAFGRLAGHSRAAEVGWHGSEALLLAAGITNVIQKVVGRSRPYVSADTNSRDFKLGGGFTDQNRTSFPSGHTTTAFALAAAVASESRTKWPDQWWSAWVIGPALYGGATVVGLSRLYHNKHWASDVALGALIGTLTGIKVVQYTHDHPDNRLDRVMLNRKP